MSHDDAVLDAAGNLDGTMRHLAEQSGSTSTGGLSAADHVAVITPLHLIVPAISEGVRTWAGYAASRLSSASPGTEPGRCLQQAAAAAREAYSAMRGALRDLRPASSAGITPGPRPLVTAARNADAAAQTMPGLPYGGMTLDGDARFTAQVADALTQLGIASARESRLIASALSDAGMSMTGDRIAGYLMTVSQNADRAGRCLRQAGENLLVSTA